jgi:hypothetical protein
MTEIVGAARTPGNGEGTPGEGPYERDRTT